MIVRRNLFSRMPVLIWLTTHPLSLEQTCVAVYDTTPGYSICFISCRQNCRLIGCIEYETEPRKIHFCCSRTTRIQDKQLNLFVVIGGRFFDVINDRDFYSSINRHLCSRLIGKFSMLSQVFNRQDKRQASNKEKKCFWYSRKSLWGRSVERLRGRVLRETCNLNGKLLASCCYVYYEPTSSRTHRTRRRSTYM
jgi:hypothetical protein